MKKLLLNITSIIITASMIFTAVGLQFHYHTCGKTGNRIFQITETSSCHCETIEIAGESCCLSHNNSTSDTEHGACVMTNDANNKLSINELNCCQDEIFDILIKDRFLFSESNTSLFLPYVKYMSDYYILSKKIEEYRYKLLNIHAILEPPIEIALSIVRHIIKSSGINKSELPH